jgi:hypothetical protein
VYADLVARLKVKPGKEVKPSKHTQMASVLSKMETAIKEGKDGAKDIYQGDEHRDEKTKEELQKNVLSIRGEDRRY